MKKLIAGLATGGLFVGMVGVANSTIINFDNASLPGGNKLITNYTESGMSFDGSVGHNDMSSDMWPQNGSAFLSFHYGANIVISSVNGDKFDLLQVDLSEYSTVVGSATTVLFEGVKSDGSLITQSFTTDGIIGPNVIDFGTFIFSEGFQNLVSVNLASPPAFALDNLVFTPSPVPEPATMFLFGTGLAGFIGQRIRRNNKKG